MQHSPNSKYTHIKNQYNLNELEELKIEKANTVNIKSSCIPLSNLVYNIVDTNGHKNQIHKSNKVIPAPVEQQIKLESQRNLDLSTRIVNGRKYEVKWREGRKDIKGYKE